MSRPEHLCIQLRMPHPCYNELLTGSLCKNSPKKRLNRLQRCRAETSRAFAGPAYAPCGRLLCYWCLRSWARIKRASIIRQGCKGVEAYRSETVSGLQPDMATIVVQTSTVCLELSRSLVSRTPVCSMSKLCLEACQATLHPFSHVHLQSCP